jgi:hypothetical protein
MDEGPTSEYGGNTRLRSVIAILLLPCRVGTGLAPVHDLASASGKDRLFERNLV